jgi:uroporphyrinogen-III synthase
VSGLSGKSILVLRSEEQRAPLVNELLRAGARPLAVSLMEFAATESQAELARRLKRAPDYDWLVFSSANAVRFCAPHLGDTPKVACIGAASAQAARRVGISVDLVPPEPWVPATLVAALAATGQLEGASILLPRGDLARDTLANALRRQGARVDCVEAYRNIVPEGAEAGLRAALEGDLDAIALTSPSTIERLFELLGAERTLELARDCSFACIGPTTAAALRERGVEPGVVAETQSPEGLVQALEKFYSEESDGLS